MSRRWLPLLMLFAGNAHAGALCPDPPGKIEPDLQIREPDLTTRAAREAAEQLGPMLERLSPDPVHDFGVRNRLQRLTGYTLRQQALEDIDHAGPSSREAEASVRTFCDWLAERGFWYDSPEAGAERIRGDLV